MDDKDDSESAEHSASRAFRHVSHDVPIPGAEADISDVELMSDDELREALKNYKSDEELEELHRARVARIMSALGEQLSTDPERAQKPPNSDDPRP